MIVLKYDPDETLCMIEMVAAGLSLHTSGLATLAPHMEQISSVIASWDAHTLAGNLAVAWMLCRACRKTLRMARRCAFCARRPLGARRARRHAGCGRGKRRLPRFKKRRRNVPGSNRDRRGKGGGRVA